MTTLGPILLAVGLGDGVGSSDVAAQGDLAAAFSGFFDNVDGLAAELKARGEVVDPGRPADVLLRAWRIFGDGILQRIRGTFSGLVTDGRTLWAFRDHFGFRPLFFREEPGRCLIATEAKQIVAGACIPSEPDLEVVERIFFGRLAEDRRCALKGVERVPPGVLLTVDHRGARQSRYWNPEGLLESARYSPEDLRARFDELMTQAVGRALVGQDVLSLSGGIDSPALAAYAAPLYLARTGGPLPCLSTVYPRFPTVDETRYITATADHLKLRVHTYESHARATDRLRDWVRLFDGPVPVISLSETFEHLSQARRLGFRNMLTGELAEFVFDMHRHVVPHLLARGKIGAALRHLGDHHAGRVRASRFFREAARTFVPAGVRSVHRKLRRRPAPTPRTPSWIDGRKVAALDPVDRRRWREDQLGPVRGAGLTVEADEHIQALAGVSVRRPWTDVDLWEFFLSLPAEVKFPRSGSKLLVRTLLRGRVPDLILDRTEKTFFDEAIVARIDYPALRRWLVNPTQRVDGVDYDVLAAQLERRDLNLIDYMWAKDLAAVHAFLSGA